MNAKKRAVSVCLAIAVAMPLMAIESKKADDKVFYVYRDKGIPGNHYIPSGWMGDYGDIKYNDADNADPADGKTDIKITYNAEAKQGANWAGIYWQIPANNWGEKPGGYDLSKYKKLTFWAKSDSKGAHIATFKMGGITGEHGDSDSSDDIGPQDLNDKWKHFEISLKDKNLTHIIGGFCVSWSRDDNPNGFTLFLDEIRYE